MNRNLLFGIFLSILIHFGLILIPNIKVEPKMHVNTVVTYLANNDKSNLIQKPSYISKTSKIPKLLNLSNNTDVTKSVNSITADKQTNIQNQTSKQLLTKTHISAQNTVLKPQYDQNSLKTTTKTDQITTQNNQNTNRSNSADQTDKSIQSNNSNTSDTGANTSEYSQDSNQLNTSDLSNAANANEKFTNETDQLKEKTIPDTLKPDENSIKQEQAAIRAFKSAVNRACNAAKNYPEALQSQNVSGKVSLILTFSTSGLNSVSISSGSGNSELDQAALNAVKRANFPVVPSELSRKLPIRVRITLTFRLNH